MTLVMAREEPLVFHDFLGLGRREDCRKPILILDDPRVSSKTPGFDEEVEGEASTRASSLNSGRFEACSSPANLSGPSALAFPSSSDPGSERLCRGSVSGSQQDGKKSSLYRPEVDSRLGKKRDRFSSRDSLQEQLQMNIEGFDSSHSMKVSRHEREEERKNRHRDVAGDNLRLTMQPPRPSAKCPAHLQSPLCKTDVSTSISNKWDCSRLASSNTGIFGPAQVSHVGSHTEKMSASGSRENAALTPFLSVPPADEGSRTGLKGSSMANLLNSGSGTPASGTAGPSLTPSRSKLRSSNLGSESESTYVSCHQTRALTSRQLTIFYGGQAHVFDEVPPDKAEAIMALAGSSGRSWSTTYSPRPKVSQPPSASDNSLSALERDRERTTSKSSAINGFSSLALSSGLHNAPTPHAQLGSEGNHLPEHNFGQLPHLLNEIQGTSDRMGSCPNKQESKEMHIARMSAKVDEAGRELI